MNITITIAGSNAPALAAEVEAFLADALATRAERHAPPQDEAIQRGDPLAVAALVLAIPSAITATLDLVTRARLAERIDQLLDRVRGMAAPSDSVRLTSGAAPDLDLITAKRDAVLDRLEHAPDGITNNPTEG
ncbi:hypothetical protein [Nitrospirillum bahiense]|uniref:Uncharacterized protein n=1 Tax=Nitrospirillum amazonense TaxID=28077 RepID=A0A560G6Z0_9PROT|nr:hypothetical protein [Nitrospirillum amazonense]TWB29655.1 hypothetical protein FBZ88_10377 [Nitrospirillum amazonense]